MPTEPISIQADNEFQVTVTYENPPTLGANNLRRWLVNLPPLGVKTADVIVEDSDVQIETENIGRPLTELYICGTATDPAGYDSDGQPLATGRFEIPPRS